MPQFTQKITTFISFSLICNFLHLSLYLILMSLSSLSNNSSDNDKEPKLPPDENLNPPISPQNPKPHPMALRTKN